MEALRHVAAARWVRKMWITRSQRRLTPDHIQTHIQTHSLGADLGADPGADLGAQVGTDISAHPQCGRRRIWPL